MGREVLILDGKDIQNSDTSGYDKFQDVSLNAKVPTRIGEYQLEANIARATWGGGKLYVVIYDDSTTQAIEQGMFIFKVVGPSGKEDISHRVTSYLAGASGQSAVPSEWMVMPEGGKYTVGGGKLAIDFISEAADSIDTTDCLFYSLPCVIYTA